MKSTLIYVHDPMCSWCWGFEPVRAQLFDAISSSMNIRTLVGGLAADSDEPMPAGMQASLKKTWEHIQQVIPGTQFNFSFWTDCAPRRSTYPSNRAVIAAREQGEKFDPLMISAIQQAYYLHAKNPADNDTLVGLASDIGLDTEQFSTSLTSAETDQKLIEEIQTARSIGADSFPSLIVETGTNLRPIMLNYTDVGVMVEQINAS
ncbi:MAG: putative protein-disulfide isomerase [Planctomycetota bacterium]|jgi:putative protein-disulfide isomerase